MTIINNLWRIKNTYCFWRNKWLCTCHFKHTLRRNEILFLIKLFGPVTIPDTIGTRIINDWIIIKDYHILITIHLPVCDGYLLILRQTLHSELHQHTTLCGKHSKLITEHKNKHTTNIWQEVGGTSSIEIGKSGKYNNTCRRISWISIDLY